MEHEVGEKFKLPDGRMVQVEECDHTCSGCILESTACVGNKDVEACTKEWRDDGKDVIFREIQN